MNNKKIKEWNQKMLSGSDWTKMWRPVTRKPILNQRKPSEFTHHADTDDAAISGFYPEVLAFPGAECVTALHP